MKIPKITLPVRAVQPIEQRLINSFTPVYSVDDINARLTKAVLDGDDKPVNMALGDWIYPEASIVIPSSLSSVKFDGSGKFGFKTKAGFVGGIDPVFSFSQQTNVVLEGMEITSTTVGGITSIFGLTSAESIRSGMSLRRSTLLNVPYIFKQGQGASRIYENVNIEDITVDRANQVTVDLVGNVMMLESKFTRIKSTSTSVSCNITLATSARSNSFHDCWLERSIVNTVNCSAGYNVFSEIYGVDNWFLHKYDTRIFTSQLSAPSANELGGYTIIKNTDSTLPTFGLHLTGTVGEDVKRNIYQAVVTTANNNPTVLFSFPTENDTHYLIDAKIVAILDTGLSTGGFHVYGRIRNLGGVMIQRGNQLVYENSNIAAWSTNINYSGTDAVIYVTGSAGVKWVGTINVDEVKL